MRAGTVALIALLLAPAAHAATLPRATETLLADLKLSPEILSGLDRELDVPPAWIEGARREGALRVSGTWDPDQFRHMNAAFAERYPFVKQGYTRGNRQDR